MKKELIDELVATDQLRKRSLDRERIASMIEAATTNMKIVKSVPLSDASAILIFRETYESIRQLGDARWWLQGFEPRNHEVSMEALKEMEIKERVRLNHLSRFKRIRNDVNYRGFKVTTAQAKEILDFWDACAQEIIAILQKEMQII